MIDDADIPVKVDHVCDSVNMFYPWFWVTGGRLSQTQTLADLYVPEDGELYLP